MALDLILSLIVVGVVCGAYWMHKRMWPNLRLFFLGLGCYLGWALFLAFVPGGLDFAWYWLVLDAPLNGGWILFWSWPLLVDSHRRSRETWRAMKANWRLMRQALKEVEAAPGKDV